jgi:flagellar basal-body rod protein FlgF
METISHIALAHQTSLNRRMSAISHNIANLNTTAYRREDLMFEEVLRDTQNGETGEISLVQDVSSFYDLDSGPMKSTGNPLDLALNGDGYFTVQTEDGPRYTRDGSFNVNGENQLVTHEGRLVLDDNGAPIEIPENAAAIEVARDGTISTDQGQVATLDIATFDNEQALKRQADSLYDPEDMQAQDAEAPEVHQGMVEGSNVQGVVEMTRMMKVAKSYQSAQQMIETDNERQLRAIRTLVSSQ